VHPVTTSHRIGHSKILLLISYSTGTITAHTGTFVPNVGRQAPGYAQTDESRIVNCETGLGLGAGITCMYMYYNILK
jgi:hypothetical protein